MKTKRRIVFLLLFMALGVFFIVLPSILTRQLDWGELSKGIGYAIFLVAGLELLETALRNLFREETHSPEELFGLADIYASRNEIEPEIARKIRQARKVKIQSTCLSGFLAMYTEALTENLARRTKNREAGPLKIILMAPESQGLYYGAVVSRQETFDPTTDASFSQWVATIRSTMALEQRYRGAISIRLNPYYPVDSLFIIDDDIYLTPYQFGRRGTLAPCYHLVRRGRNPVYDMCDQSFDHFWSFLGNLAETQKSLGGSPQ